MQIQKQTLEPGRRTRQQNIHKLNEIRIIVSSVYDGMSEEDSYKTQQSLSQGLSFDGGSVNLSSSNENATCISVCRESGRSVTGFKNIINIWNCDFERGNISNIGAKTNGIRDRKGKQSYRLGATSTKKPVEKSDKDKLNANSNSNNDNSNGNNNENNNSNKNNIGRRKKKKEITIVTVSFIIYCANIALKKNYLAFASHIATHSQSIANRNKQARLRTTTIDRIC